jgi:hypothetical protein
MSRSTVEGTVSNLSSSFWMMMFIRLDWLKLVCNQINIPEQYAKSVFGRKEERKW